MKAPSHPDSAVLDAAPDAVITIDGEGRTVQLNRMTERLFGFPADELLGKRILDLIVPPAQRDACLKALREMIAGGPESILNRRVELAALRADGVEIPVEVVVTRPAEASPCLTAWVRDLAEQRETEGALARRIDLFDRAEQVAEMGSWQWNLETDELLWSDNLFRLSGLEPGDIPPTLDSLVDQLHPADKQRLMRGIERARETGTMLPVEYRSVLGDGNVRHFRARSMTVERAAGQPRTMMGIVEDLTARRHAERELSVHFAVSEALDAWETLDRSGSDLLRRLAEALGCEVGGLWLPDGGVLVNRLVWSRTPSEVAEFAAVSRRLSFPSGVGLVGRAWESGEPIHIVNMADPHDGDLPRREAAARVGLRGGLAIAARTDDEILAVLDFYSSEEAQPTDGLIRSLTDIGHDLGRFLDHRRGELAPPPLTARELEVLQLAANGLKGRAIAEQLVVAPATVKSHLSHIYAKLGASDRASGVATALRQGLID